jgi:hypothetical protein
MNTWVQGDVDLGEHRHAALASWMALALRFARRSHLQRVGGGGVGDSVVDLAYGGAADAEGRQGDAALP